MDFTPVMYSASYILLNGDVLDGILSVSIWLSYWKQFSSVIVAASYVDRRLENMRLLFQFFQEDGKSHGYCFGLMAVGLSDESL